MNYKVLNHEKNNRNTELRKNKKNSLVLFLFIFTIMFSFEIAGYNMRYIIITMWTLYSLLNLLKHNTKITINYELIMFPAGLLFIILYSFMNITINETLNYFEILRSTRAFTTYLLIFLFLSLKKHSTKEILNTLSLVLLLHAISIILGIIYPPFKEIVLPISQYSKEFMPIRSSGFLSGFDDAGFLCNVGLLLTLVENSLYKRKLINIKGLIFIAAVIFTSRFNIVCLAIVLVIAFFHNVKVKNIKGIFNIVKYITVIGIFVVVIWSLTTSVGAGIRNHLYSEYPIINSFYTILRTSYTDYGVYTNVISNHARIVDLDLYGIILGVGEKKTNSDIGYIKTIYSVGIIGILIQIFIYTRSMINIRRIKNNYVDEYSIQILTSTYIIAVILMFIMEMKNSFIFSSTTFEMLSIIYIACILSRKKIIK